MIGAVAAAAMAAVGVPQGLMTVANCVELGLQVVLPAVLFGAVAGFTSQLAGTVRGARLAAAAVLAVAFMVRAVADAGGGIGWVRWFSPLAWFEEMRPPGVPPASALLAILGGTAVLVAVCLPLLGSRDIGRGVAVNGYVAAMFSLIQLVAALLTVALVVAARGDEATGRLEILFAMPRTRIGWLAGRTALAAVSAAGLALVAAGGLWVGAELSGERLGVGPLLAATGNCLPLIVVTAGVTSLILGIAPRAVASGYAVVAAAYLWDALGGLFHVPSWTLNLSPFHALAQVPLERFTSVPAVVLGLLGTALCAAGLVAFRHRDLAAG